MKIIKFVARKGCQEIEIVEDIPAEIKSFLGQLDRGHKRLAICTDENLDFQAFIAVHDTTLGPGLGGCRIWDYHETQNPKHAAIIDVLRLSEAMTYKNSAAGLNLGGGKAILLKESHFKKNRPEVLRSFGRFVEFFGGDYVTAEDMGATPDDMVYVAETTKFATGTPEKLGGSGNSSYATAVGISAGLEACCDFLGTKLSGLTVSLQGGCGHVARPLIRMLHKKGVNLVLSDIPRNREKLESIARKYGAIVVGTDEIYDARADIFCPCAKGAVLNDDTIPRLQKAKVRIVGGAANNQLEDMDLHGVMIRNAGILYAPDFVINSGGVINIAHEKAITGKPYSKKEVLTIVRKIYDRLLELFTKSEKDGIGTAEMARHLAVLRINKARQARGEEPLILTE